MEKLETQMSQMADKVDKIYACLMGDETYRTEGLYPRFERVEQWYIGLKREPVLEAVQNYNHIKWLINVLGATSVVSVISFIILMLHTFKVIG